jgi:hypothetical protein
MSLTVEQVGLDFDSDFAVLMRSNCQLVEMALVGHDPESVI